MEGRDAQSSCSNSNCATELILAHLTSDHLEVDVNCQNKVIHSFLGVSSYRYGVSTNENNSTIRVILVLYCSQSTKSFGRNFQITYWTNEQTTQLLRSVVSAQFLLTRRSSYSSRINISVTRCRPLALSHGVLHHQAIAPAACCVAAATLVVRCSRNR